MPCDVRSTCLLSSDGPPPSGRSFAAFLHRLPGRGSDVANAHTAQRGTAHTEQTVHEEVHPLRGGAIRSSPASLAAAMPATLKQCLAPDTPGPFKCKWCKCSRLGSQAQVRPSEKTLRHQSTPALVPVMPTRRWNCYTPVGRSMSEWRSVKRGLCTTRTTATA